MLKQQFLVLKHFILHNFYQTIRYLTSLKNDVSLSALTFLLL